jgi:hypothetical protein
MKEILKDSPHSRAIMKLYKENDDKKLKKIYQSKTPEKIELFYLFRKERIMSLLNDSNVMPYIERAML